MSGAGAEDGALDICWRAQCDGHDVRWFYKQAPRTKDVGKDIVERVDDFRPWLRWADLVYLADNTLYLRELDYRRQEGLKVIGATEASAQWELDRSLGQRLFQKHKIAVADYREFGDYDSAIAYVKRQNRPFVSKPIGDEPDKSLSYVAKSAADLVYMLQRWKKAQKLKGRFILQSKISGIEMAVGGWIGPNGFIEGFCENWEEKKLMAGGMGPNIGEAGTTLRMVRRSKLADMVLKPLEADIVATGHTGYVDVNCIVTEDGTPYPLEFTMRPGWPTMNIQQELLAGDAAEWMMDLAEGRDPKCWIYDTIAIGAAVLIPDYPYSRYTLKDVEGVPIYGIEDMMDHIHPCGVMMGTAPKEVDGKVVDAQMPVTASDYVMIVTATGKTVSGARRSLYSRLKKVEIPASAFHRIDLGERLQEQLPLLQKHGFAKGIAYA